MALKNILFMKKRIDSLTIGACITLLITQEKLQIFNDLEQN